MQKEELSENKETPVENGCKETLGFPFPLLQNKCKTKKFQVD